MDYLENKKMHQHYTKLGWTLEEIAEFGTVSLKGKLSKKAVKLKKEREKKEIEEAVEAAEAAKLAEAEASVEALELAEGILAIAVEGVGKAEETVKEAAAIVNLAREEVERLTPTETPTEKTN